MTAIATKELRCAACGATAAQEVVLSTSAWDSLSTGLPDLDLRPPETERSLLRYGVQCCCACGYCAEDLARHPVPAAVAAALAEPLYRAERAAPFRPALASAFVCASLLAERAGDLVAAATASLRAAWACDDVEATAAARSCRERAAALYARARAAGQHFGDDGGEAVVAVDVLRRAGALAAAAARCDEALAATTDDVPRLLLRYERRLIAAGDTARHRISDAFERPSYAPSGG